MVNKVFVSFLFNSTDRNNIKTRINQRFPTTYFIDNPEDTEIKLRILKRNEIALIKRPTCVSLTIIALNRVLELGIDPFEWCFSSLSRMNLFLDRKSFCFLNISPNRKYDIAKKIKQMHGDFCDCPDYYISEIKINPSECEKLVVSPAWFDALYVSSRYIEPIPFIYGKQKPGTRARSSKMKENAIKTPREVIMNFSRDIDETAILRMQMKERTPDIFTFFKSVLREKDRHMVKSKQKNNNSKFMRNEGSPKSQGCPFQKPNTDTIPIDTFLKTKNDKNVGINDNNFPQTDDYEIKKHLEIYSSDKLADLNVIKYSKQIINMGR